MIVQDCTQSDSSRVILVTLLLDSFLVVLNLFPTGIEFIDVFLNLDGESTVATWYSSSKLLVISLLAWSVAREFKKTRWSLGGLALFTLALSASETAMIHERLSGVLHWIASGDRMEDGGKGIWVIYFLPVVLAVVAWLVWTARVTHTFSRASARWMAACLALWSGVVLLEVAPRYLGVLGAEGTRVLSVFEEAGELWGATCLLGGLLTLRAALSKGRDDARIA